jgi:hypothetical protein
MWNAVDGAGGDKSLARCVGTSGSKREWRSKLGVPPWEVETWVGSYEAIAAGEFETADPALAAILGRPASDLKIYLSARPSL